jgi:hypothetical protein
MFTAGLAACEVAFSVSGGRRVLAEVEWFIFC